MARNRLASNGSTVSVSAPHSAIIIDGTERLRFGGDIAFDIETAPLHSDHEDGALLNAETARVAAIGYYDAEKDRYIIAADKDDAGILRQFWDAFLASNAAGHSMIGFNTHGFDLPFMMRRSWIQGIPVPRNLTTLGGRYFCDTFPDLMAIWKCGSYRDFISLDSLARNLDSGAKTGSGEQFWKLWDKDRKSAVNYLVNDVRITYACARRMGLVPQLA